MDTQAMTFGGSSTPDDIQRQRDAIPPMVVNKMNLISDALKICLLYTSPSPRDKRQSRMPSSA